MGFKDPFKIYTAASNIEAHMIVEALGVNGIEAFAEEDLSGVSLWAFGTISQFHQPNVWIEKSDTMTAAELIREFEEKTRERQRDKTAMTHESDAATIDHEITPEIDYVLYGADLISDGYEYYPDWCAMMNREFDDSRESTLKHDYELAKSVAGMSGKKRIDLIARYFESD